MHLAQLACPVDYALSTLENLVLFPTKKSENYRLARKILQRRDLILQFSSTNYEVADTKIDKSGAQKPRHRKGQRIAENQLRATIPSENLDLIVFERYPICSMFHCLRDLSRFDVEIHELRNDKEIVKGRITGPQAARIYYALKKRILDEVREISLDVIETVISQEDLDKIELEKTPYAAAIRMGLYDPERKGDLFSRRIERGSVSTIYTMGLSIEWLSVGEEKTLRVYGPDIRRGGYYKFHSATPLIKSFADFIGGRKARKITAGQHISKE